MLDDINIDIIYCNRTNTQIGTKCDFIDSPRITFEAVADAMFA